MPSEKLENNKLETKKKEYEEMLVQFKEKEQNMEIASDAILMISRLTLVTPIDKSALVNIYIRFMLGDDSKEIVESPFTKTWYIPL